MMLKDQFSALIPLRGGSKGIPKKNIKELAGRPLCYWTIRACLNAGIKTYVSTDSDEIAETVKNIDNSIVVIVRPDELAMDHSSTEDAISHALNYMEGEHIVLLQATSPLTNSDHLLNAIQYYSEKNCLPLVSGTRSHRFFWNDDGSAQNYNPISRPRRQDWNGMFQENGAFYIFSKYHFEKTGSRCSNTSTLYEMEEIHSCEIDSMVDWRVMEILAETLLIS